MKTLFIINPAAGGGNAKKVWESLKNEVFETIKDAEFIFTKTAGDASKIARDAEDLGFEALVSCGGDGTLNEVINGAVGTDLKITVLPLGTGSDFGKSIGIKNVHDTLRALTSGKEIRADLGKLQFVNENKTGYFINVMEVGYGANVMQYVNAHRKTLKKYAFIFGIIATMPKLKKFEMDLEYDSKHHKYQTVEIIVANGRYFGGGMLASPDSKIDDGILDLHILKPVSKLTTVFRLRNLIDGTYIEKGYSYDFAASHVTLSTRGKMVEVDGEVIGTTPVSVSIERNALRILVP